MDCEKCGKEMVPDWQRNALLLPHEVTENTRKVDATRKNGHIYVCPDCDVETIGWWIFKKKKRHIIR